MNFKKLLKDMALRELGNTTDTFDWRESEVGKLSDGKFYNFETPEHQYAVDVFRPVPSVIRLDFQTLDLYGTNVTDEGVQFKVVSTVLDIAEHVWRNKEKIWDDGEQVRYFVFSAEPKEEEKEGNTSRGKLYRRFIKSRFPDAQIEKADEDLYKVKPNM